MNEETRPALQRPVVADKELDNLAISRSAFITMLSTTRSELNMPILEDRGLFWWNDKPIPSGAYAPDNAIGGTLTIEDTGAIRLELDGVMPGDNTIHSHFDSIGQISSKNIQGILKRDSRYVHLSRIAPNGGTMNTHGISYEIYIALYCLVSKSAYRMDYSNPLTFRSLRMDLAGLEEWLWLRAIKVKRRNNSVSARYKKENDVQFSTSYGKLSIEYDFSGPNRGEYGAKALNWKELCSFKFTPSKSLRLKDSLNYYNRLEELIMLLTDSDYSVDWPTLKSGNGRQISTLYYFRTKNTETAPGAHQCLISFPTIRDNIGFLFSNIVKKREQYGPGFYLYLGIRRGAKMFVEHRFVNLIWGLEAFDRRGSEKGEAHPPLQAKIDRILAQITAKKDKEWLEGRLKHATEPKLEKRLLDLFSNLGLPFQKDKLSAFCEECARLRNDISHFGGVRKGAENYDTFVRRLMKISDAVASLYHLHLLKEIGVEPERFDFGTNNNWRLSLMKRYLQEVDLLEPENKVAAAAR